MVVGSPLTRDEERIAAGSELDLAVGYPRGIAPPWLRELVLERSAEDIETMFWETRDPRDYQVSLRRDADIALRAVLTAACRLIDIPLDFAGRGFVTYSGSHALERAITTCVTKGTSRRAVTSEPSIDIVPAMLRQHRAVLEIVAASSFASPPSPARIIESVAGGCDLVVLSSPENPTGSVYSAGELEALASGLTRHEVPLVIDHASGLVCPHETVSLLPNIAADIGAWAAIWDTGKTLEMGGEKLGFVFCSTPLTEAMRRSVEVLQYALPKHKLMLFALALETAARIGYPDELSRQIEANLALVTAELTNVGLTVVRPNAGAFVLLDWSRLRPDMSGLALAEEALEKTGVGVVGIERFLHAGSQQTQPCTRLALARDPCVIDEAARRIAQLARSYTPRVDVG